MLELEDTWQQRAQMMVSVLDFALPLGFNTRVDAAPQKLKEDTQHWRIQGGRPANLDP